MSRLWDKGTPLDERVLQYTAGEDHGLDERLVRYDVLASIAAHYHPDVEYHCDGATPVVDGMWKAPNGVGGTLTPIGPADPVRIVTNDFMFGGGDGYTVFAQGTNVAQPGDDLLQVTIDYIAANSPVAPKVEGRVIGP